MPFNGSGVFSAVSLPGSWNPAISGQDATPDDWNSLLDDIELGLSTCWTTDGQSTISANQPMAGFKFTGVGDATARTQYASMGQIQDGKGISGTVAGTADAITLTTSPVITAYALNQVYRLIATGTNTTAVTLNVDTVGTGPVKWPDGTALVAADIKSGEAFTVMVADISTPTVPVFHLQTVASAPANKTYIQVFTSTGTYTPHAGMLTCLIECVGAGGGGGGTANTAAVTGTSGGGGGAGSISRKLATATDIGVSKAVTIGAAGTAGTSGNNAGGAGGDTSVGTLCIAKGGSGGSGSAGSGVITGGLGGVAGTGDVVTTGAPGFGVASTSGSATDGGAGGSSPFGGGGRAALATATTAGNAASGHGGGGGGGGSYDGGGAAAGGAGTAGYVVITEYCNQ